jgi:acetyl esterase/lipase
MKLDDAYANIPHIPGGEDYPPTWEAAAEQFRAALQDAGRLRAGISYGPGPRQALDLLLPDGLANGICLFVHGGYWLKFHRHFWSHFAAGPLARGWAVAIPSYDLCPDVRIADITAQIARATRCAAAQLDGPMVLAGHSAGGHLVGRMCVPGQLPENVLARVQHVMPISPLADLRPLLQTSMNEQFRLDEATAIAESPALMQPAPVPVTVWVGGEERPAFLDQARWLAEAWGCDHVVAAGKHHLNVIDGLADPDNKMVKTLLKI